MSERDIELEREEILKEIAEYQREKERIKNVLGTVGGTAYSRRDAAINIAFLVVVIALFVLGLVFHFMPAYLSLEISVLLVSIKIVWMMYSQHKFNHFQFWILHSLEYRLNDITSRLQDLQKSRDDAKKDGAAE